MIKELNYFQMIAGEVRQDQGVWCVRVMGWVKRAPSLLNAEIKRMDIPLGSK